MVAYLDENRLYVERLVIEMDGRFFPDSSSAVDNTLNKGHGFSVVRTGVGAYSIVLEDDFLELVNFSVDMQLDAVGDMDAEIGDIDLANKIIQIRVVKKSDGTAVEAGAYDANQSIAFKFAFKKTTAI